jgi:glycosyltransferase involved in cell wall biosynthesis
MARRRRLLTVGHSYVIGLNRRLAHEMARAGSDWDVTCVAPRAYRADLKHERFVPLPDEPCRSLAVSAYATRFVHVFSYSPELKSLLRRDWDAVYAWEEPYVLAGFEVARWTPKNAVFTFLTLQNIRKRYPPPFSWFERATLARADGWFYCGHSVHRAQHDKPGYRERPSRFGPLGVDIATFFPDAEARRRVRASLGFGENGPPVVGFVGRFVEEKGLSVLMRALDGAREPWRALFLGGGPLETTLRRWGASKGDRVRVATVSHDDVPAYLNAMDLLCAPSETAPHWAEQFGRVLVEGFACRVPVVGSDSGEIPHVVADAGAVVPERDVGAWTAALDELLGDARRRDELAERGLARARSEYAWPVVARRYLDFLTELVDDRSRRASLG